MLAFDHNDCNPDMFLQRYVVVWDIGIDKGEALCFSGLTPPLCTFNLGLRLL